MLINPFLEFFDEYYLKMETKLMNTLNSKTNESNRFIYQFTDKLNVKNPNKNMTLAYLSIHYTWKNIKSVSDIQDYFEYIIKKT